MTSLLYVMLQVAYFIGPTPCHARVFIGTNAQFCLCAEDVAGTRIVPRAKYKDNFMWVRAVCTNQTPVICLNGAKCR